jgi:hemerythrin
MPPMSWNKNLSVGVEVLDEDHKKIFVMINELQEAIAAGHRREVLEDVLGRLMDYTMVHLAREEEFFAQTGYADAIAHKNEHHRMVSRVRDVRERFTDGSVAMLSLELRSFLQNWWILHIQGSDQKYGLYLNAKGIQ